MAQVSRRDFLRTAGVTAGVAVAAGYSPFSYAANSKVRVGKIGTGAQGLMRNLNMGLMLTEDIEVIAVCDVYEPHLRRGQGSVGGENVSAYYDYREMLDKEELDAVVISTSQHQHYQPVMDALDAGKYVFCEKTLTYDIQESRNIVEKCHETGLFCQVGHQRRYNPQYLKAVWLAREQAMLGRIHHMSAHWHQNLRNGWRRPIDPNYELNEYERQFITDLDRHLNWRLYKDISGGLVTEFATHQVDIWNWFLGTMPKRVWGSGNVDYWRDGREVADNIVLVYEYEVRTGDPGFVDMDTRIPEQDFAQINRPYEVRANYSCLTANAQGSVQEFIRGDEATFQLSEPWAGGCYILGEPDLRDRSEARGWRDGDGETDASTDSESSPRTQSSRDEDAEAIADAVTEGESPTIPPGAYREPFPIEVVHDYASPIHYQFAAMAKCIKEGGKPYSNEMVGHLATVTALCGLEAIRERKVVEIDPALFTFDFETPDPYQYEYWPDPEHA